jgi:proteasome lid subunit RPN8/RPN11
LRRLQILNSLEDIIKEMPIRKLILNQKAIEDLMAVAKRGYEAIHKKEVGGHLLGYPLDYGYYISRAIQYNTASASRTSWSPNQNSFERKGRDLEKKNKRLKWIGTYHSHVEIRGTSSAKPSYEDKEAHRFSERPVEIIISITNRAKNWPKKCLPLKEKQDDYTTYYYDICGYINSGGIIEDIKIVKEH